jgi:hypothetical protein
MPCVLVALAREKRSGRLGRGEPNAERCNQADEGFGHPFMRRRQGFRPALSRQSLAGFSQGGSGNPPAPSFVVVSLRLRIPARALGAGGRNILPDGCCRARWSARLRAFWAIVWHAPTSGRVPCGPGRDVLPAAEAAAEPEADLGTAMVSGMALTLTSALAPAGASAGARRHRERRVAAIAVSTRDQSQPWVRTKQAYPGVSVLLLAAGGKVRAVIAIERSDIMVGVGTIENGALAIRQ